MKSISNIIKLNNRCQLIGTLDLRGIFRCGEYKNTFAKTEQCAGYIRGAGYTRVRAIFANLGYLVHRPSLLHQAGAVAEQFKEDKITSVDNNSLY